MHRRLLLLLALLGLTPSLAAAQSSPTIFSKIRVTSGFEFQEVTAAPEGCVYTPGVIRMIYFRPENKFFLCTQDGTLTSVGTGLTDPDVINRTFAGNDYFTGANFHFGPEEFSGTVNFSGAGTHSGTENFSGAANFSGPVTSSGSAVSVDYVYPGQAPHWLMALRKPEWVQVPLPSARVRVKSLRVLAGARNWGFDVCQSKTLSSTCRHGVVKGSSSGWSTGYTEAEGDWTYTDQSGGPSPAMYLHVAPYECQSAPPYACDWMTVRVQLEGEAF